MTPVPFASAVEQMCGPRCNASIDDREGALGVKGAELLNCFNRQTVLCMPAFAAAKAGKGTPAVEGVCTTAGR